jgi:hypothetical protein
MTKVRSRRFSTLGRLGYPKIESLLDTKNVIWVPDLTIIVLWTPSTLG